MRVYEVRPRKDHRGVDLISDALPFSRLWYVELNPTFARNSYPLAVRSICSKRLFAPVIPHTATPNDILFRNHRPESGHCDGGLLLGRLARTRR
jgi:hypothetical protein